MKALGLLASLLLALLPIVACSQGAPAEGTGASSGAVVGPSACGGKCGDGVETCHFTPGGRECFCSPYPYAVSGTVAGLARGQTLTFTVAFANGPMCDAGGDSFNVTVQQNGLFPVPVSVTVPSGPYAIEVPYGFAPPTPNCTVQNGAGDPPTSAPSFYIQCD
jgi:hypothetical protein